MWAVTVHGGMQSSDSLVTEVELRKTWWPFSSSRFPNSNSSDIFSVGRRSQGGEKIAKSTGKGRDRSLEGVQTGCEGADSGASAEGAGVRSRDAGLLLVSPLWKGAYEFSTYSTRIRFSAF